MHLSKLLSYGPLTLFSVLTVLTTVNAHGHVKSPASRQESCDSGAQDKAFCDNVQDEPQSVEALKGGPFKRDVGDAICNGNGARFDALNIHNSTLWPKRAVEAGKDIQFEWVLTMPHPTTGYYYYATKVDWDYTKSTRLTKDDFDEVPILSIDGNNQVPPKEFSHTLAASQLGDRLGHTIILAVWEVGDTPNAFYNCIDLNIVPTMEMVQQGRGSAQMRLRGQTSARQYGQQARGNEIAGKTLHMDCTVRD